MANFGEFLQHAKKNLVATREVIKNDTVFLIYDNKLYQMSKAQGVRYPWTPTDEDLLATDYVLFSEKGNVLVEDSDTKVA